MKFTQESGTEFKGGAYTEDIPEGTVVKQISCEFKADREGVDLNFFFKAGDGWTYLKPVFDGEDKYPKTGTEWKTIKTVEIPADTCKYPDIITYPEKDTENGTAKCIGFEIYEKGSDSQPVSVSFRNFKVIDQNGKEIELPSDDTKWKLNESKDGATSKAEIVK